MNSVLTSLALLLLLPLSAHAALVSQDLATPGDGQVTLDTGTGLLWLDLPLSAPQAIAYANAYTADGWAVASLAQVQTLIGNQFGSSTTNGTRIAADPAAAQAIVGLFGATFGSEVSWGRFQSTVAGRAGQAIVRFDTGLVSYLIADNAFAATAPDSYSGVMYVKPAAVPEPGAVALVVGGLVGVAAVTRRRRAA